MRLSIAAVLLLACSSSLAAQSNNPLAALGLKVVQPMSANELAATKARIAAELANSQMSAFFDDVSTANGGQVRHRPSGLTCMLGKKGQRVRGTLQSAVCENIESDAAYTISVVQAPAGTTLAAVTAAAQAGAAREPGYKPYPGTSVVGHPKPGSDRPDHNTIRFFSKASGPQRAVRLQVGIVRGWILTDRKETKNFDQGGLADLLGEATFGTSMDRK